MSTIKLQINLSSNSFNFENDADVPYEQSDSLGSDCSIDDNDFRYVISFKYF